MEEVGYTYMDVYLPLMPKRRSWISRLFKRETGLEKMAFANGAVPLEKGMTLRWDCKTLEEWTEKEMDKGYK